MLDCSPRRAGVSGVLRRRERADGDRHQSRASRSMLSIVAVMLTAFASFFIYLIRRAPARRAAG